LLEELHPHNTHFARSMTRRVSPDASTSSALSSELGSAAKPLLLLLSTGMALW
jgi:hypothetical protein